MQDIKPDTSLYTEAADRLIAFGLVLKAEKLGEPSEYMLKPEEKWQITDSIGRNTAGMAANVVGYFVDYRTQPKPRELWAIEREDGSYWPGHKDPSKPMIYTSKPDCALGHKAVRFVEQP